MHSPLNTTSGTGLVRELTDASSRQLGFNLLEASTLSFAMPGHSGQTAALRPLISDVLVFRDEVAVQRFRVVSRVLSKASNVLTASFTAVSYRALLDGWVLHDMAAAGDTAPVAQTKNRGHRSWPAASLTAAQREQSLIAWTILDDGQSLPASDLGIGRGHVPTTAVARDLTGATENFQPVEYFAEGQKRGEAIQALADLDNGFEWDIIPDPASPYTDLRFHVWALADGGRNQHAPGRSELVLDDGGALASWSHSMTPAEYANVGRFTGAQDTSSNIYGAAYAPVWLPATKNPAGTPAEGRWERDLNNSGWVMQANVAAAAPAEFKKMQEYTPELTLDLTQGRWQGPAQLWLGDKARCIITEPVDDEPGEWILYVDEDVRVVEATISIDDLGAEDVSLSVNRPRWTTIRKARGIDDRLSRIERR